METVHPMLPDGPVVCEVCSLAGRHTEMQRHAPAITDDETAASDESELQTYRCPDCESVAFFRVD
jgi:hypothetical protein